MISEVFGIEEKDYKTLAIGEKIRVMTAAYAVSLGKAEGLRIFKEALIVKRSEYTDPVWQLIGLTQKVDLVEQIYYENLAYVSASKISAS